MTQIVNINFGDAYDVYIGRGSQWGNPYTHRTHNTLAEHVVETRAEAVEAYRKYITEGAGKHLLKDLYQLKGKKLGCFCSPSKCHGDILKELADKLPEPKYTVDKLLNKNNGTQLDSQTD
jgi:hypothetical protein